MSVSISRERGCPAVNELDLLRLARGQLPELEVQDLLLLMASFHSVYERWAQLAGHLERESMIDQSITLATRARVEEARMLLRKK